MLILYIHGFLSSPQSYKAQQVKQYCQRRADIEFACPFLPVYPDRAIAILENCIEKNRGRNIGLIGSSLGGFYATNLSQRHALPAVLVNPAVRPYNLLAGYLDQDLRNYHTQDVSRLSAKHVQQLRELEVNRIQYPALIWLMAQTGDEVLDYRQAVAHYRDCKQNIEEGGDHGFQNFDRHLPEIMEFLSNQ